MLYTLIVNKIDKNTIMVLETTNYKPASDLNHINVIFATAFHLIYFYICYFHPISVTPFDLLNYIMKSSLLSFCQES